MKIISMNLYFWSIHKIYSPQKEHPMVVGWTMTKLLYISGMCDMTQLITIEAKLVEQWKDLCHTITHPVDYATGIDVYS